MIRKIIATGLFVRDLASCIAFYRDTLGFQEQDGDAHSAGFAIGDLYFFLQDAAAAADLLDVEVSTLKIGEGPRGLLAASVEDVDAMYATLKAKGVTLLRPPTDQPWGLRTAHFADPEGNIWEINQPVTAKTAE